MTMARLVARNKTMRFMVDSPFETLSVGLRDKCGVILRPFLSKINSIYHDI